MLMNIFSSFLQTVLDIFLFFIPFFFLTNEIINEQARLLSEFQKRNCIYVRNFQIILKVISYLNNYVYLL